MRARAVAVLGLAAALLPTAAGAQAPTAAEVVAAERAFAARVREAGVKAGFSEYLAPDGVVFRPGPVNGREFFAGRPASAAWLSWRPAVADISTAGDLGYSTGPYESRAAGDAPIGGTGWYLSIWRRQPDGTLRLLADHGIASATLDPDTTVQAVLWPAGEAGESAPDLPALDEASTPAPAHELVRTMAAGALHRGAAARAALFGAAAPRLTPVGGGVARSRDLGYTYGSYLLGEERGFYLRVWRWSGGRWQVVAESFNPTRP